MDQHLNHESLPSLLTRLHASAPGIFILTLLVLLAGGTSVGFSSARWLPDRGKAAVHQRCLDIENPAVAMIVALQPGDEDLPLMAYLRFHLGVKTVCVFLTNGEGTPGDTLSRFPLWMTGERKLEADRVAEALGSEAWFLNVPDLPGASSAGALASVWDSAGVAKRLVYAIRSFKPDVIVLCSDKRAGGSATHRDSAALTTIRRSMVAATLPADTSNSKGIYPWSVSRLYVQENDRSMPEAFAKKHPLFHRSALDMGAEVGRLYRTLRLQLGSWIEEGRRYLEVRGNGIAVRSTSPQNLMQGLPHFTAILTDIRDAIRNAVRTDAAGVKHADLGAVAGAIDKSEHVLTVYATSFSPLEQRLMLSWKNGLEALRCALLGITATVSQSETLLTASQIWDLRVAALKPFPAGGTTEIVFPLAINGDWPVNETLTYHFALKPPQKFNVLTPPELPFAIPAELYGLRQPSMRTTFPYIIVHRDAQRERNFLLRGEVVLRTGPRRSFALRTPLIFEDPSSPIIFALQNFSRDAYKGVVTLSDSSGEVLRDPVALKRKDEILQDTLFPPDKVSHAERNHRFVLELSGKGGERSITARNFTTAVDSAQVVGLLSGIDGSPLEDALRVIHQPRQSVTFEDFAGSLAGVDVLLVDRDVSADPKCTAGMWKSLGEWVRAGGRAVVFPQHGNRARWLEDLCGCAFARIDPLPATSEINLGSKAFELRPNRLEPDAWEGWVESRAFDRIEEIRRGEATVLDVSSGPDHLVQTVRVGKGTVTLVALDVMSQLVNYHPGAFHIVSNLLSLGRER